MTERSEFAYYVMTIIVSMAVGMVAMIMALEVVHGVSVNVKQTICENNNLSFAECTDFWDSVLANTTTVINHYEVINRTIWVNNTFQNVTVEQTNLTIVKVYNVTRIVNDTQEQRRYDQDYRIKALEKGYLVDENGNFYLPEAKNTEAVTKEDVQVLIASAIASSQPTPEPQKQSNIDWTFVVAVLGLLGVGGFYAWRKFGNRVGVKALQGYEPSPQRKEQLKKEGGDDDQTRQALL